MRRLGAAAGWARRLGPGFALGLAHHFFTPMPAAILLPLLTAAGASFFWLFYKSIDFFENI